jgi:hypothetical protein
LALIITWSACDFALSLDGMMSIDSSKFMLSRGAYHTEIVFDAIADIIRNFSSLAILRSEIVLGIMLIESRTLLDSMFQSLIFSLEAAKRYSEFLSSKHMLVIGELSDGVTLMFENFSRSQYFTVRSVEPFARARF